MSHCPIHVNNIKVDCWKTAKVKPRSIERLLYFKNAKVTNTKVIAATFVSVICVFVHDSQLSVQSLIRIINCGFFFFFVMLLKLVEKMHLNFPGCGGLVCSPVALCVPNDTASSNPPSCPPLEQWCPFQRRCLPLSSPCQPSSCPNCTHGHHLPPGTWRPQYLLQNEVVFTLPAGPAAHIQVR